MKPIVVAVILSLVSAGGAVAADVDLPAPLPPSPPASYYPAIAPFNWGGVYIGINGGYGLGSSDWTNQGFSTGSFGANGFLLGGTLGVNYAPIGTGFVFGVEGDFDWSTLNGSSSATSCAPLGVTTGAACETRSDWLSTLRARAGYAFDHILIFATAGGAIGDFQVALNPPATFLSIGPQMGWTAGAGIEFAFTDNLTAKVEYLYVDLGTISCPAGNSCPQANALGVSTASVSLTENIVRAGVNYKFSW